MNGSTTTLDCDGGIDSFGMVDTSAVSIPGGVDAVDYAYCPDVG